MVETNLKIINELKLVLEEITTNTAIRSFFTINPEAFIRDRKLTMKRIIGIIINLPKRSLSVEIKSFFNIIENDSPATKGAFSLQRMKLLPVFFQVWNKWLVDSFYEHYGEKIRRWKGFRLLAVDGSTVFLIDRKDVVDYFGTQGNQHCESPMARVMQIYDVLNEIIVSGNIYPIKTSEQSIASAQVESLFSDSITLFDRGFPGYELMFLMLNQENPRHFIIRCKTSFNKEVAKFIQEKEMSKMVEFKPSTNVIAKLFKKGHIVTEQTTIKIRMVKVKLPSDEIEVLLTNLYNEDLYILSDFKYLYGLRWGIETSYGTQKNQMQMEQFSGHRVICIQQDYAASLFVANLQSLICKQCEDHLQEINLTRKYNYKINRNVSWASVKDNIVRLFLSNNPFEILVQLKHIFERYIEPIRPGRNYKRIKKVNHRGKYRTLTNYKRAF